MPKVVWLMTTTVLGWVTYNILQIPQRKAPVKANTNLTNTHHKWERRRASRWHPAQWPRAPCSRMTSRSGTLRPPRSEEGRQGSGSVSAFKLCTSADLHLQQCCINCSMCLLKDVSLSVISAQTILFSLSKHFFVMWRSLTQISLLHNTRSALSIDVCCGFLTI